MFLMNVGHKREYVTKSWFYIFQRYIQSGGSNLSTQDVLSNYVVITKSKPWEISTCRFYHMLPDLGPPIKEIAIAGKPCAYLTYQCYHLHNKIIMKLHCPLYSENGLDVQGHQLIIVSHYSKNYEASLKWAVAVSIPLCFLRLTVQYKT